MPRVFPSRDELMKMPLNLVRGLDIRTSDEERMVQDVVNVRLVDAPLDLVINRSDVPDIKTKEEEEKWQKVINDRESKARGLAQINLAINEETIVAPEPIFELEEAPPVAPPVVETPVDIKKGWMRKHI